MNTGHCDVKNDKKTPMTAITLHIPNTRY